MFSQRGRCGAVGGSRALVPVLALLLVGVSALAAEQGAPPYKFPRAVVPYVGDAPPKIDGVIGEKEYQNFAAVTGMVTWGGGGGGKTLVPKMQEVVWYLGYDDKYLYITMHSPNPPGVWPLARVKKNDDGSILWDDHTEIQISRERARATFPGVGFYKIMANARGFWTDEWYYNGTPGTEGEWATGGPLKCTVTKDYWDLEIAVDLRALEAKKLDGQSWVLQLLRADKPGGTYFAGWAGEAWMSWGEFGEVTFDRSAPAVRFLDTGELAKGEMRLRFQVAGQTKQETPVKLRVSVTDGDGKSVFDETKDAKAVRGKAAELRFDKDVPLTERGNTFEVLATCADAEGGRKVLYHVRVPIIKLTPAFYEQHIAPWFAERPKGDLAWAFAYWPSYNVAKTSVDVDFFGIKDELAGASAFEVSVAPRGKAEPLVRQRVDIKNKAGNMLMKGLDLAEGDYTATLRVLGPDGKKAVDTRSIDFVRRHYPWEGNKIGMENKVIPPFTPIKAEGKELEVWGRKYTLGDDGLLSHIVAGGGAGPEDILTAPLEFVAGAGGQEVRVAAPKCAVEGATPPRVNIAATGKLGPADYKVNSYLEFDGWYQVRLTLTPAGKEAALDYLTLRVPLWKAADTIYVQRAGDGRRGNKFGALPQGKGRVWDSSELIPYGDWGSFVPIVFVGTGDKGVWWFADDKRGWTLSDKKPAVEILRGDNGVELRVNVFADRTVLTAPRVIEFSFLIDPVKQMPDERKWGWGKLRYGHNTYGYRYYGGSVDGFENSDADLEALNRVLTDPNWKAPDGLKGDDAGHVNYFRYHHYKDVAEDKVMLVLYGSTWLTGLGLDAFDTYGGEWLGQTNWSPSPQTEYKGRHNMQCTKAWETPRDLTTVGVNFPPSFEDCFVWHHQRLISKAPVNGTWWDNSSIGLIEDYDAARGEFYNRFNVSQRRQLTKRLATMGYEVGRPPWWVNNMHVDWSFCQVAWHIENDFYVDNADMTMQDQLSVDEFRSLCRTKRGIIHRLASRGPDGTIEQMRRMGRSQVGMCLLHDIGSYNWGSDRPFADGMLKVVDDAVGYFDGAEFVPYWRNSDLIKIETPGVYASVYRGKGKAVIVALNANRADVDVRFELGPNILGGKKVERFCDGETGFPFSNLWDYEVKRAFPGELKPHFFGMTGGAVRLLLVE